MANDTDKLARNAIGGLITAVQPKAVVWPYNALSHKLSEWPAMFRQEGLETAHGWVIKESGLGAGRKGNGNRDRQLMKYDVWGFYTFRTGRIDSNSDDEFSAIRDDIYEAIRLEPHLTLDGVVDYHDLLQFPRITTIDCGEETLHFAQGQLMVHLCC